MDDAGDTAETATRISDTDITEFVGEADGSDTDVFSINLVAGQTIEVLVDQTDPRSSVFPVDLSIQTSLYPGTLDTNIHF